jgi:acyl-coenzyme A synthetase/AMP-(fatty) acid ligase
MSTSQPVATTLLDLFDSVPPASTAVIVPEQHLRVTYGGLRSQIEAVASQLAAAGVRRGDPRPVHYTEPIPEAAR